MPATVVHVFFILKQLDFTYTATEHKYARETRLLMSVHNLNILLQKENNSCIRNAKTTSEVQTKCIYNEKIGNKTTKLKLCLLY